MTGNACPHGPLAGPSLIHVKLIEKESGERPLSVSVASKRAYRAKTAATATRKLEQGVSDNSTTLIGLISLIPGSSPVFTAQGHTGPTDPMNERDRAEREADIARRRVDIALGASGLSPIKVAAVSGP